MSLDGALADSRPDTLTPSGMVSRTRTLPLAGSMWRISLWSPSHVPCQSSPSAYVRPKS